jgi:acyl-CoA reductase-like NAD-dependent aldehyde dehydrogenase
LGKYKMTNVELLIGGASRQSSSGICFLRHNPVSGEPVTSASAATLDDADAAVSAAAAALPAWAALSPGERRARLQRAATLLVEKCDEFVSEGVREIGGSVPWYAFNVKLASEMLVEAASMTTQICGEIIPSNVAGSLAMAMRQPAGVVLGIAPWNAPVILGVRALAMPLACGNTVVLKASEICPAVHLLIGTALQEAGLGDGVVNVITNSPADAPQIVERLIANPLVRRVNFTGSTTVGRIVAKLSAAHLKPALLELGGKAPLLVLDDADLDAAVAAAAFGAFFNQGQICMSTERLIVDEAVADEFADRLAAKTSSLKAGRPGRPGCALASMVSAEAAQKIEVLVKDAVAHGAVLAAGGGIEGSIMQPTVLDHVDQTMKIYSQESFGPVVAIIRAKGEEEAIRLANDTEYGLSAAIFSRDTSRALRVAARIRSGICHINGPTVHDEAQMPFGGVGASGYGRFGGKAAIAEFTDLRWITIQQTPRGYPI